MAEIVLQFCLLGGFRADTRPRYTHEILSGCQHKQGQATRVWVTSSQIEERLAENSS